MKCICFSVVRITAIIPIFLMHFVSKTLVFSPRFEDFFRKNRRFFHELLKIFSIRIGDFLYLSSLKTSEL